MAYEDETVDNRYSAIISQICKNCRMLIKSRLCFAGIKFTKKQSLDVRKLRQYFSMREVEKKKLLILFIKVILTTKKFVLAPGRC